MKARLSILLMILLVITGCYGQTNDKILKGTMEKIAGINSYQYIATIEVYGNKDSQEYEVKHYYKDGKYRLESIRPKHLKGKVVIINNQRAKIYHPNINQSIIIDNIREHSYEGIFLGDFINWEFQNGMECSEKNQGDKEYLILTRLISRGEDYHHKQSLWIDKQSKLPQYIKIYDKKGQIRVNIIIKDLILNKNYGDELFDLREV